MKDHLRNRMERWASCVRCTAWFIGIGLGSAWGVEVAQYPSAVTFTGWPADDGWAVLSGLDDANNGVDQRFDFVGDTTNPGGYWAEDSSYLFIRMRVQTNSVAATTYDGSGTLYAYIDTNNDGKPDFSFAWDKKQASEDTHGLECVRSNSVPTLWSDVRMDDVDGSQGQRLTTDINGNSRTGDGYVRSVDGQATTNFGTTTFIDIAVRWSYLRDYSTTGLDTGQTWRIAFGSDLGNDDNNKPPATDVAGGASPGSLVSLGWSGSIATPVVLLQLYALEMNGLVKVGWSTSSESKTAGFDLYRKAEGVWVKINEALIPAQGWPNGGVGATYSVTDPGAQSGQVCTYKLVERTTDGRSIDYGPYERTVSEFAMKPHGATAAGVVLRWLSRTGERYRVLKCTDLASGRYEPMAEDVEATPPENEYIDPAAGGAGFYRIELQP